ncbi:stage II sporulation protein R [Pullulanibacillus sp. KACC 23026]|uniref:stage II sporulation protein R n=1 Tax=Pullulanibacillus sp. KACC 23026 TaxID=3028315 RepID=UPI0023AF52F4|nr:stage II sporulation protein R [Pullulanibacillus sp. KACC 23026]WEG13100.1 stage II sporulation protein R [Pullulanibacillus sp. KACC 23026]
MRQKSMAAFILLLAVFIFFMQLEKSLAAPSGGQKIPKDAIRLRILANSDSAKDQAVKREIRDQVNANVETWVKDLKTAKQAKKVITAHLDDIRQTVKDKLDEEGIKMPYTVTLGEAKFPTKMYGGYVYPAGIYQALVVTLGSGQGANWWCVLFPPLCFLDFANGDAVKPDPHATAPASANTSVKGSAGEDNQVQVHFFFVDLFKNIFSFFKGLFHSG